MERHSLYCTKCHAICWSIIIYLLLRLLKDKEGVRRKLEVEEAEYISRRKECVSNLIKLEQQVYQSLFLYPKVPLLWQIYGRFLFFIIPQWTYHIQNNVSLRFTLKLKKRERCIFVTEKLKKLWGLTREKKYVLKTYFYLLWDFLFIVINKDLIFKLFF